MLPRCFKRESLSIGKVSNTWNTDIKPIWDIKVFLRLKHTFFPIFFSLQWGITISRDLEDLMSASRPRLVVPTMQPLCFCVIRIEVSEGTGADRANFPKFALNMEYSLTLASISEFNHFFPHKSFGFSCLIFILFPFLPIGTSETPNVSLGGGGGGSEAPKEHLDRTESSN